VGISSGIGRSRDQERQWTNQKLRTAAVSTEAETGAVEKKSRAAEISRTQQKSGRSRTEEQHWTQQEVQERHRTWQKASYQNSGNKQRTNQKSAVETEASRSRIRNEVGISDFCRISLQFRFPADLSHARKKYYSLHHR
jgi:hypothetical protein